MLVVRSDGPSGIFAAVFIDTHAHLYHDRFEPDRSAMVQRALDAGVSQLLLPNVDHDSIEAMHALSAAFPDVCRPMMGLHPCSVSEDNVAAIDEVERLLRSRPYCAVGEIGIDLYWDKTWLVQQQDVFRQQVRWAKELGLPIVIHCRESFAETIAIVEEENDDRLRGVFHCFTGTAEDATRITALGEFYLGIGGVITYPNGGLDRTMTAVGPAHCVLETDAPYLSPVPNRGKRNESSYIPHIAERLAACTGRSVEEIALITTANARKLFNLPTPGTTAP